MRRRATLLMELIAQQVIGCASDDPAYQAPLWDASPPVGKLKQLIKGLVENVPDKPRGFFAAAGFARVQISWPER